MCDRMAKTHSYCLAAGDRSVGSNPVRSTTQIVVGMDVKHRSPIVDSNWSYAQNAPILLDFFFLNETCVYSNKSSLSILF